MNKAELVKKISSNAGVNENEAEKTVDAFLEVVSEAMFKGEMVSIVNFGTFEIGERRSPHGDSKIKKMKFTPSKKLSSEIAA